MATTARGTMRPRRAASGPFHSAAYCYSALALCIVVCSRGVEGFATMSAARSPTSLRQPSPTWVSGAPPPLQALPLREAEVTEQLVGGVRYSMIPIPKDMLGTTLFVTNLDEFVYDDDLSSLFQGMPACVVRKPDMTSLGYGFVAFRSHEEAQAALIRTRGVEWRGRRLDVQEIRRDLAVVRVPERLVAFVNGAKAVRRILQEERQSSAALSSSSSSSAAPSKKPKVKAAKSWSPPRSSSGSSSSKRAQLYRHLKPDQRAELDRALARGFLVLDAPRHSPRLVDIHRRCCDARGVPQVMVVRGRGGAGGGPLLDRVLVDLSPLRLQAVFDDPDSFLVGRKIDIFSAATASGMELLAPDCDDARESCELVYCAADSDANDDAAAGPDDLVAGGIDNDNNDADWTCAYAVTIDAGSSNAYATKSISKLPPLSVGIFVGDRPRAKAMAKELASAWELPDPAVREQRAEERAQRRQQRQGKAPRRNRGGGNHQEFW